MFDDDSKSYQIKELAKLAKVSVRTLHYYDEIGLLKPSSIGENGYRYYDQEALLRLQQIMLYRELDFKLKTIKQVLDSEDFDLIETLESQRSELEQKHKRLDSLIQTIDSTLKQMKGKNIMEAKDLFEGFDEAKQAEYEKEVVDRWGEDSYGEFRKLWGSYSAEQKKQVIDKSNQVYIDLANHLDKDLGSEPVQALIAQWHQNLRYFYAPNKEIMLGLAEVYTEDDRFRAFYEKIDINLAPFLREAIEHYCESITT